MENRLGAQMFPLDLFLLPCSGFGVRWGVGVRRYSKTALFLRYVWEDSGGSPCLGFTAPRGSWVWAMRSLRDLLWVPPPQILPQLSCLGGPPSCRRPPSGQERFLLDSGASQCFCTAQGQRTSKKSSLLSLQAPTFIPSPGQS